MNASRFAHLGAAFERAWRDATEPWESDYVIAGVAVHLRVAGPDLARHVHEAIAHLRADSIRPTPELTIDLWDARATGVAGPAADGHHAAGTSWHLGNGTFAVSDDRRFVSHALRNAVLWMDRRTPRILGCYSDGNDVSLHQRGKPLQMLLALWASDRGLVALHTACVTRDGAGVLIPGRSGSGKSTVALACLQAGFGYLGDDWIGIGPATDSPIRGYGLYSSIFLDPHHARRFPSIAAHLIPPRDPAEEKSLLLLADLFPEGLLGETRIRAIALPRFVAGSAARVRPAAKRDALLVLGPSTIFEMHPRVGREGIDRLTDLVRRTPAYWLEIGSDIGAIPNAVDEILAAVREGPARG